MAVSIGEAFTPRSEPGIRERVRRALPIALVVASFLAVPTRATAQRDPFYSALVAFYRSLGGLYGDEGPQVSAQLRAMATTLRQWDTDILDAEGRLGLRLQTADDTETKLQIHVTLASLYIERGRLSDALRALDEAIRIDPSRSGLHRLMGVVLQVAGRAPDAAAAFRTAWLLEPNDPQNAYRAIAYRSPATTSEEIDRARETLAHVERELIARPGPGLPAPLTNLSAIIDDAGGGTAFVPAAYALGFSLILRGELERGVDELRAAAGTDPLVREAMTRTEPMAAGIAALRRGEVASAIQDLEAAVTQARDSSEAHRILATAYAIVGDVSRSVQHLRDAIRRHPQDERSRLALVRLLTSVGRSAEAEEVLRSAIAELPDASALRWRLSIGSQGRTQHEDRALIGMADRLTVLVGKGELYRALAGLAQLHGDDPTVIDLLQRAVRLTPNSAAPHKALGRAYVENGRDIEGYAELVVALLLDPGDVETLTALGRWHLMMDQPERSAAALERAVSIAPADRLAVHALALALIRAGRLAQGKQCLDESQRLQAQALEDDRRLKAAAVLRFNAEMRMTAGDYGNAIEIWQQVIHVQPRNGAVHLRIAEALAAAGRAEDAVAEFLTAISLQVGADAHRRLADLYERLGRHDDADRARAAHVERQLEELRQRADGGIYGF